MNLENKKLMNLEKGYKRYFNKQHRLTVDR